jgi:hypothetical protein
MLRQDAKGRWFTHGLLGVSFTDEAAAASAAADNGIEDDWAGNYQPQPI